MTNPALDQGRRGPGRPIVALLGLVAAAILAAGCGGAEQQACGPVEFEGQGEPDAVLVSDLPLHGPGRAESLQINDAVRRELRATGFMAGSRTVGFQPCDDSTPEAGTWDPGRCNANANDYADDDRVIAVLGPLDSRCAAILIPVLNRAPDGGIPLVSPSNLYTCLTRGGPGCDVSEPDKYYPSGSRTYLRVVGNDLFQAAADAESARDRGVRRVFVLHDREAYGVGLATSFRNAARALGIDVVGFDAWDPDADSYVPLMKRIGASGANAIFLGGSIDSDGARLLRTKTAVLGANDGPVQVLAPDGFRDEQALAAIGPAARGLIVSAAGTPASALPIAAKDYASTLAADLPPGERLDPGAVHGAEAARLILDAIARSDGSRIDVLAKLFATHISNGLIGTFGFDRNGDPKNAVGPVVGFTMFRMLDRLVVDSVVEPSPTTVRAAATGT